MRTTISLNERLAKQVRREAEARGISMSAFIASILDDALKRREPSEQPPFNLVTVSGVKPVGGLTSTSQGLSTRTRTSHASGARIADHNAASRCERSDLCARRGLDSRARRVCGLGDPTSDRARAVRASVLVLSGFVRVATNPRVFEPPSTLDQAFAFISALTGRPNARIVGPGPDHLDIFETICRQSGAAGKLAADAQHAAVAVEHSCTFVTTNSDFSRFPGLRWQHPLSPDCPV